jgi:psiF repeat
MSLRFNLLAASALLALSCSTAFAQAAAPAKTLSSSQQKMVDCNKQATGQTGAARKAFMSTCLKGGSAAAAPAAAAPTAKQTQQEKMKSCNVDAKTKALKGDDRKTFMSNCLKASPSAPATP